MRQLLLLSLFFLLWLDSFSQSLAGQWKGTFTAYLPFSTTVNDAYKNDMQLEIVLNQDSTYSIFSYAGEPYVLGHYSDHKCETTYIMLDDENIFIEETKVIEPQNAITCFKKMNLKIIKRKKYILLEGSWITNSSDCDNKGEIKLWKK
jgi:hypothetical protein